MYFKTNVPFVVHSELQLPNLEVIWAEVKLNGKQLLIGTFYVHPRFTDWNFNRSFHITSSSGLSKHCIN